MASSIISTKNKTKLKTIKAVSYATINILPLTRSVKIEEILPFRIRISNIQIPGYSATNPPPITIQVIGFSNYIL